MIQSVEELQARQAEQRERFYGDTVRINVGLGTCGIANGAQEVFDALADEVAKLGLNYQVRQTGCVGYCQQEPMIDILAPGLPRVFYGTVTPKRARTLVRDLARGEMHPEWALMRLDQDKLLIPFQRELKPEGDGLDRVPAFENVPFYSKQMKIALRNCGFIDPHQIGEYLASGGYSALAKVLTTMTPEQVIETIEASGLRGRGGGGFLTGRKWRSCRQAHGYPKYVLCNGDEGDPGAFMDRAVMEGNPFAVLEGMAIGAYAIGSDHGYIYVRLEYPLAVQNLRLAIRQAEEMGLLGQRILGTDFNFTVRISRGAGAFVCGESTALMASIEGLSGEPRAKHIHTAEKGLFAKPTNLNNVETWANVPVIVEQGAPWFAAIGNEGSKGTKVFSVVGRVKNTGLVEVPMGMSLREIIFDIAGGIPRGRKFKAVQTGGPSGGCLPESQLDLPVDFDRLTEAGSMMGSGGMIVMDEWTCVVEIARYFTDFLCHESCGKCVACREGVFRMREILERISNGGGALEDLELLEELCHYVRDNAICGLGKSAPNPALSTLTYFRDEYLSHVRDHRCPAGVCRELTRFIIDATQCKGCGQCVKACPVDAVTGEKKTAHVIDADKCIRCGACREACRLHAVLVE